jgi:lipid-A-disaccharide synthase-like uncharacterized protein
MTHPWMVNWLFPGDQFLGIEWHAWKVVGWTGNLVFASRFLIQWWATERQGRVVVPAAFWWCSLAGSWLLFTYATFYQRDSVFIAAYALSWVPYIRNLWIHRQHQARIRYCTGCRSSLPTLARFCPQCGQPTATHPGQD